MQKNKIDGAKPFNEFWLVSCYSHALIAGLACFGIKSDAVLSMCLKRVEENFKLSEYKNSVPKINEKIFGYKCKPVNIDKKKLIRLIDSGYPVIVGIDHFYLKNRSDTYGRDHGMHFILVVGYDLETGEVNIIDHDYANSFLFKEKVMSIDNLLEANGQLIRNGLSKKYTCRFIKKAHAHNIKFLNPDEIMLWGKNSHCNILKLEELLTGDVSELKKRTPAIIEYLRDMKRQNMCYSCLSEIKSNDEISMSAKQIGSAYSNLAAMFWKMLIQGKYEFAAENIETIKRKTQFVFTEENKLYGELAKVYS